MPDLVEDLTPVASQAQSALPEAAAPFPLTQVTDKLPVGEALTPGHSPLDNVAGNMARNMEESMGGMEGQAKGGLGSPLGGASPLGQLPTDSLPVAGDANPLQALPLPGGLPL
ncbi:hypothetical protein [Embleya sp. NBC_00896]|uniref:hypothetical protein n=1 Tax=Embleya sp. NBC_00896 TaxID=2975961 RepID=UPI003870C027|nr:hypothetical protein OG928_12760 [Embleya sp. NBC_00896]